MGSTPFNTTFVQPVQIIGVDGQYPAAVDNPLPVELATGSINITAVISGAVILGPSTASIGSATVFQGTNPWLVGNNTASLLNATVVGTTVLSGSLPAGTNAIGSTTIIGSLPAGTNAIGSATIIGSLPSGNNPLGKINYNATTAALSSTAIDTTIGANATAALIAGTGSTAINIYRVLMTNSTASTLTFRNGTTALTGAMSIGTNGAMTLDYDGEPWFTATGGAAFNLSSTVTSQVSGRIYYLQA